MKLKALLHNKLFIGITAAVVAAGAVAAGLLLKNRPEAYRVIKVFEVDGKASVTRTDVGELTPYEGMNLESGDAVSTFSDSSLRMILDDTKYVRMEPNTDLELTASGNASENKTCIVLKSGSILNEITQSLSVGSSYEVTAPKATMAVVGTSFRVSVEKDEHGDYVTKLYVFHGMVKVNLYDSNGNPTGESVIVGEDKCVIIKTVHGDNSNNDPTIDGFSFFVYPDDNGDLVAVPEGGDPRILIDYYSIPYDTLKNLFDTNNDKEIMLYSTVLEKVIEAMNGHKDSNTSDPVDVKGVVDNDNGEKPSDDDNGSPAGRTAGGEFDEDDDDDDEDDDDDDDDDDDYTGAGGNQPTVPSVIGPPQPPQPPPPPPLVPVDPAGEEKNTIPDPPKNNGGGGSNPGRGNGNGGSGRTNIPGNPSGPGRSSGTIQTGTQHTVTFCDRNGKAISVVFVEHGKSASAPTVYDYADTDGSLKRFAYWDKDISKVLTDLEVHPVYKSYFTVRFFDKDNHQIGSLQYVEAGKTATAPAVADYTGTDGGTNKFAGWDQDIISVKANLEVRPVFKTYYSVKFYDKDDKLIGEPQLVERGKDAVAPEMSSYTDGEGILHEFTGWSRSFKNVTENISAKATYTNYTNTVYYNVTFLKRDGVTELETVRVKANGTVTPPEMSDYDDETDNSFNEFTGWDKSLENVTESFTTKPVYTKYYKVTFLKRDGETTLETKKVKANGTVTPPEMSDYDDETDNSFNKFTGWDKSLENVTKSFTTKPKFTKYFHVYFKTRSGSNIVDPQLVKKGGKATAPEYSDSYKNSSGWTMIATGWSTDEYLNVQKTLTVTPTYTEKTRYTVTFYDYNDEVLKTQEVETGGSATPPGTVPDCTDSEDQSVNKFAGSWDKAYTNVSKNLDVKAKYDKYFYVYFKTRNGSNIVDPQLVKKGGAATAPEYSDTYTDGGVTKVSDGWDTEFTNVTSVLNIKPTYYDAYIVQFLNYNDDVLKTQTVKKGKDATAPTTYTDEYVEDGVHYTFTGWNKTFTNVTANLTVKPTYSRAFEVTFYDYNGTTKIGTTQIIPEGGTATAPEDGYTTDYSDAGVHYEFAGSWDKPLTNVSSVLAIKPVYSKAFEVKFYDRDGTTKIGETQIIPEGESAEAPEEGFTPYYTDGGVTMVADGWDTDFSSVTSVLNIKPKYVQGFTVRFLDKDSEELSTQIVKNGTAAEEPTEGFEKEYAVNKVHYKHTGWDKAFTNVTADLEIRPTYSKSYEVTFHDYNNTQIGSVQIVAEGGNATAPTTGYTKKYTDSVTGKTMLFKGWKQSYTNVKQVLQVKADYGAAAEINLTDRTGAAEKVIETDPQPAGSTYKLPSYETPSNGYNAGWFKAFSGVPTSATKYTSITVESDGYDNQYVLARHASVTFKLETEEASTETFTLFSMSGNTYILMSSEGFSIDFRTEGYSEILGMPLENWTFKVNGAGSDYLPYAEVVSLMQSSSTPVLITGARGSPPISVDG